MKPKIKSSIVFTVLLFVFSYAKSFDITCVKDTIILDGEKIYIEKDDVVTNVDSLQEEASKDIKNEKIRKSILDITLEAGANLTLAKYVTSVSDQQPLDVFMDRKRSMDIGPNAGVDVGVFLYRRLPLSSGERKLSLQAGFFYNQLSIKSTQMTSAQLQQDSLIHFTKVEDELYLAYFFNTDPGNPQIGEVDTIQVDMKEGITKISCTEFPIRLRWTQSINRSMSWFVETGIVYRMMKVKQAQDNYLLNAEAEFSTLKAKDFIVDHQILPTTALGFKFYSEECDRPKAKALDRLAGGGLIRVVYPFKATNNSSLYYFDTMTFSLNLFVSMYF